MAVREWLTVGRIGGPFGVKGWVHVESYTDPPERLLGFRHWNLHRDGNEPAALQLAEGREHGNGFVARLDGVRDRNAAALLQGAEIAIARSELPPLGEREFYQVDL